MIIDTPNDEDKRLQESYITEKSMKELLSEIKEFFEQRNEHPFILRDTKLTSTVEEASEEIAKNSKTSQSNPDDEKLPDAIMWLLTQNEIANSRLQDYLKIGNNRAKVLLSQMEELALINRLNGNKGWEVKPKHIEDMSAEAINLLEAYGFTEIDIKKVLMQRSNNGGIFPVIRRKKQEQV